MRIAQSRRIQRQLEHAPQELREQLAVHLLFGLQSLLP
jgi:hypothetical protein